MGLSSRLNCRVRLWGRTSVVNDLGESDFAYKPLRDVWAEVLPTGGSEQGGQGGTVFAEVTHKVTVRAGALPELTNDMYLTFRGQRYDVKYAIPNYKLRDRIEIYCRLVVDG